MALRFIVEEVFEFGVRLRVLGFRVEGLGLGV